VNRDTIQYSINAPEALHVTLTSVSRTAGWALFYLHSSAVTLPVLIPFPLFSFPYRP